MSQDPSRSVVSSDDVIEMYRKKLSDAQHENVILMALVAKLERASGHASGNGGDQGRPQAISHTGR